jgi:hypothetical protein
VQRIEAVRDSTLDLKTTEQEFRRIGVNYPFEFSSHDRRLQMLKIRKEFPNGFLRAVYECDEVYKTNKWVVPSSAHFVEYWPNFKDPQGASRLVYEMRLNVENINILPSQQLPDLVSASDARVWDFRYETATSRTKFNFAGYSLKAGETFPGSRDPKLLAQMNEWLENGPVYDNLASKRHKLLVGMFAITVIGTGLLTFLLIRKNKTKT